MEEEREGGMYATSCLPESLFKGYRRNFNTLRELVTYMYCVTGKHWREGK
ncbi:hypothetical protein KIPB_014580, partial [Kipferlia bialata]|eukprot:g14580.t1